MPPACSLRPRDLTRNPAQSLILWILRAHWPSRPITEHSVLAIFRGHRSHVRCITLVERRNVVGEYQVSLFAVKEGGLVLDLHPINSSGTSPYVNFESCQELLAFLASLNLSEDLLVQVKALCATLRAGHAFHQKMFLPRSVEDGLRALHGQAVKQLLCA